MKKNALFYCLVGFCAIIQASHSKFAWKLRVPETQEEMLMKLVGAWLADLDKAKPDYNFQLHELPPCPHNYHVVDPEVEKEYEFFDQIDELLRQGFVPVPDRPATVVFEQNNLTLRVQTPKPPENPYGGSEKWRNLLE